MTRAGSDRPLQKVTMNFYRDDVAELVRIYGNGWTSEVREIVARYIHGRKYIIDEIEGRNDG